MSFYNRKLNRLKDYNYSQNGYYYVTMCVKNRINVFGKIRDDRMCLNRYGRIVNRCWFDLVNHYINCRLDEFVVMSNHIHGIIVINNNVGNGFQPFQIEKSVNPRNGYKPFRTTHGLSEIVRGFKTFSSKEINKIQRDFRFQWQKSFYDHIIRDEKSLNKIREYIKYNPTNWNTDRNNITNIIKSK